MDMAWRERMGEKVELIKKMRKGVIQTKLGELKLKMG
jgi:hypothetical protein